MKSLQFDHFEFCPQTRRLSRAGRPVELRPKTAELLRTLLLQCDQVVTKRELVKTIWHTEHVSDQSVFQAISELRATLAPLEAIKTFPNRGYQWVLPVRETRPAQHWLRAAAAIVFGCVLMAGSVKQPQISEQTVSSLPTEPAYSAALSLPALVAFSEGAAALQSGQASRAVGLLELSVAERPEFSEAHLLLAEAYLLKGDPEEASRRVSQVMDLLFAAPTADAYALIAAMDLRSRTDQQLGQMNSALKWAALAADQANTDGFECTAADLHDRVLTLVDDPAVDRSSLQASPVLSSAFAQRVWHHAQRERRQSEAALGSAALARLLSTPPSELHRPEHCVRFGHGPQSLELHPYSPVDTDGATFMRQPISG